MAAARCVFTEACLADAGRDGQGLLARGDGVALRQLALDHLSKVAEYEGARRRARMRRIVNDAPGRATGNSAFAVAA